MLPNVLIFVKLIVLIVLTYFKSFQFTQTISEYPSYTNVAHPIIMNLYYMFRVNTILRPFLKIKRRIFFFLIEEGDNLWWIMYNWTKETVWNNSILSNIQTINQTQLRLRWNHRWIESCNFINTRGFSGDCVSLFVWTRNLVLFLP